ncbi:MAG TPA: NAD(P)H-quinone oxidoreductase subunit L [Elainellaceae cyanobacterium]
MDISLSMDTLLVIGLYVGLGGTYLIVLPLLTFFYLKSRWNTASSIERLLMYFFVFFCFPGMLLLSPFLNFRPKKRQIQA